MAIFKPTIPPMPDESQDNSRLSKAVPRQVAASRNDDELIRKAVVDGIIDSSDLFTSTRDRILSYIKWLKGV